MALRLSVLALFASVSLSFAQHKPTWDPNNLPDTTEQGQSGTNKCGTGSSQDSMCQTAYVNSLDDFCLWAPPTGPQEIGSSEEHEVAWCTSAGRGTRVIPPGAIKGAHFLQTPNYIQITGHIDGTMINIAAGDAGGELDPHGATGNGNPIGSLVFTNAFGNVTRQVKEWMSFMSDGEFCVRICNPSDPNAWLRCQHIYDTMGCGWVMPGNYENSFDSCQGDTIAPPGVYGQSTFHQGDPQTPPAHAAGKSSNCQAVPTINPVLAGPAPTSVLLSSASASLSSVVSSASASASASVSSATSSAASASSRFSATFSSRPTSAASSALPSATPSTSTSSGQAMRVSASLVAFAFAAVIVFA